jgi:hypothetical protein
MTAILHEPDLFQPRFDSVAFAPGRTEAHSAKLAKEAKTGRPLDPVTVVAFGDRWFLVDGHHRFRAYQAAGWTNDIPVQAEHSPLMGPDRVEWAIGLSFAENKKDRLGLADSDKMTRAWQAVAREASGSIATMAERYGVSPRSIAYMREIKGKLEKAGKDLDYIPTWRRAKAEVRHLNDAGDDWTEEYDRDQRVRTALAKRLKPVMEMQAPARLLLEALEAYDPNIWVMLQAARMARDVDESEEEEF